MYSSATIRTQFTVAAQKLLPSILVKLNSLITLPFRSVKEKKTVICTRCSDNGKTVDASCRCLECKERLCQDCKAAHNTFKLLKGEKTPHIIYIAASECKEGLSLDC